MYIQARKQTEKESAIVFISTITLLKQYYVGDKIGKIIYIDKTGIHNTDLGSLVVKREQLLFQLTQL